MESLIVSMPSCDAWVVGIWSRERATCLRMLSYAASCQNLALYRAENGGTAKPARIFVDVVLLPYLNVRASFVICFDR